MSCYHPMIGIPTGELTATGKKKLLIKQIKDSRAVEKEIKENPNAILIPCGKCVGCRLDYSKRWADRMCLELETAKKGIFVTLTYDNEHMPRINDNITGEEVGTLDKRDLQLFLKRLRKHFSNIRIRFFGSGEYGPNTHRPHYHVILFGLGLSDFSDLTLKGMNELKQQYYFSPTMTELWNNGFTLLSEVSWQTCAYVARYVVKKIADYTDFEERDGRLKEFSLMSRKPGIGKLYLDLHPECIDIKSIALSTEEGGREVSIPNYYYRQLIREPTENFPNPLYNPEKYAIIKEKRRDAATDSMFQELDKTDKNLVDYLKVKEMNKVTQIAALKRNKVM